jgi:hypothetical protein
MTDDHKSQLSPVVHKSTFSFISCFNFLLLQQSPVKKISAEDLTTWHSADDLDERPSNGGAATARASSEDENSRVARWAVNFDRLLQDTAGLATFTVCSQYMCLNLVLSFPPIAGVLKEGIQ